MIRKQYVDLLQEKDIIFEQFQEAMRRAELYGEENVYDFSIGDPFSPPPASLKSGIIRALETKSPLELHGYSPSLGVTEARKAVAASLNKKYGSHYDYSNIFISISAAGALAHAFRAVTCPGDEILTFAPCFSEYKVYTSGAGLTLKVVPADTETFQINFALFEQMLTPTVSAVIVNSPNNPTGIVYSKSVICRLAEILKKKSQEYGHTIYLISDEPYREILFRGVESPYIANYYPHTLTCYSYSKSLSIPGERVGYLAVNPECEGAETIISICPQISRTIGHNGAASLFQHILADVCDETADMAIYETNKDILCRALREYGYSCIEPNGTFYMFPRSPEPDAVAFCARAAEKNLMLVPGDGFCCPGHFRIAYCVPTERVERALPIFKALAQEYHLI